MTLCTAMVLSDILACSNPSPAAKEEVVAMQRLPLFSLLPQRFSRSNSERFESLSIQLKINFAHKNANKNANKKRGRSEKQPRFFNSHTSPNTSAPRPSRLRTFRGSGTAAPRPSLPLSEESPSVPALRLSAAKSLHILPGSKTSAPDC